MAGQYETLKAHFQKRNDSILAHGLRPAGHEDFEGFWKALLNATRISHQAIPRWPVTAF